MNPPILPLTVSITPTEIKPNMLYVVNVDCGKLSPQKTRDHLAAIEASGIFDPLAADCESTFIICPMSSVNITDVLLDDLGYVKKRTECDPTEFTKDNWDSYINQKLLLDNRHYDLLITLLTNQYYYITGYGNGTAREWKLQIDLVIDIVDKAKIFDEVQISPLVEPVELVTINDFDHPVEAKTRLLDAVLTPGTIQENVTLASDIATQLDLMINDKLVCFCPYILVMVTHYTPNPDTSTSQAVIMTRYGDVTI